MFFDDYAYQCVRLFEFQARDCYLALVDMLCLFRGVHFKLI